MRSAPLNLSYERVLETLGIRPISHFSNSRESLSPNERLKQVEHQARTFVDDLKLINQQVSYLQTFDLVSTPYLVQSAFGDATKLINPYLYVTHRFIVIQYSTHAGNKTLLFSPSDTSIEDHKPQRDPIKHLIKKTKQLVESWLTPRHNSVESALQKAGILPESIDFICYSNLQGQDLRKWLGSYEKDAYFPNAKLLVMHQEWEAAKDMLPLQSQHYPTDGLDGIHPDKIIPLHSSIMLGDSLALIQTPGKTQGNQTLIANTDNGISAFSHNGISADNYSPQYSTIYGLAEYSAETRMSVIPNGEKPELSLDQYISMQLEKAIADSHPADSRFQNIIPVAELSARWQPFALSATLTFSELKIGEVITYNLEKSIKRSQHTKQQALTKIALQITE
jgi:hypothetical protein